MFKKQQEGNVAGTPKRGEGIRRSGRGHKGQWLVVCGKDCGYDSQCYEKPPEGSDQGAKATICIFCSKRYILYDSIYKIFWKM